MFEAPLYKFSLDGWEDKKALILDLLDIENRETTDRPMGQLTDYYTNKNKASNYLDYYREIIFPQIAEVNADLKKKTGRNISLELTWFQSTTNMQWHQPHNHGLGFASILYVEFDPEVHAATSWICPFGGFFDMVNQIYTPKIKEGDLVFFPSFFMHYQRPSGSDKRRTIISSNYVFEKRKPKSKK